MSTNSQSCKSERQIFPLKFAEETTVNRLAQERDMETPSVSETLRIDALSRMPGLKSDMHLLEDITTTTNSGWQGELPCIMAQDPFRLKVRSSHEFRQQLLNKVLPTFRNLDWSNLLLAGGSVAGLLGGIEYSDLDFFIYGLETDSQFYAVVERTMSALVESQRPRKYQIIRTDRYIQYQLLYGAGHRIQFILRHYATPSEVLHSFDIGSSAVGFDGRQVWATSLGKFSLSTGCNIVNLDRYSASFEHRLAKYFHRGFGLILPQLRPDTLDLQQFKLGGERLQFHRLHERWNVMTDGRAADITSDYEFSIGEQARHVAVSAFVKHQSQGVIFVEQARHPSEAWTSPLSVTPEDVKRRIEAKRKWLRWVKDQAARHNMATRLSLDMEKAEADLQQKEAVLLERLAQIKSARELPPITRVTADTMLGSFEPRECDPREWYGSHYAVAQE